MIGVALRFLFPSAPLPPSALSSCLVASLSLATCDGAGGATPAGSFLPALARFLCGSLVDVLGSSADDWATSGCAVQSRSRCGAASVRWRFFARFPDACPAACPAEPAVADSAAAAGADGRSAEATAGAWAATSTSDLNSRANPGNKDPSIVSTRPSS